MSYFPFLEVAGWVGRVPPGIKEFTHTHTHTHTLNAHTCAYQYVCITIEYQFQPSNKKVIQQMASDNANSHIPHL